MAARRQHRNHGKSKVKQLPDEVRRGLEQRLSDEGNSIDSVVDWANAALERAGSEVRLSWSSVQRYSAQLQELGQDLRTAQAMAQAIGRDFFDEDGEAGRLIIQALEAQLLRVLVELRGKDSIDVETVRELSTAVAHLQRAKKTNVETGLKIRASAIKDAADAAVEAATDAGLSDQTVEAIKARILGVAA